jgi:hypothetical protein
MTPLRNREGQPVGFLNILRDNTRVQAEGERRALMLSEMSHRVKNALATVQAVALGTLRQAEVPMEVRRTLTDRIVALAQSHDLLAGEQCEGVPLAQVIERVLSPYGGSDRAVLSGADIRLPANTVEMLGLALPRTGDQRGEAWRPLGLQRAGGDHLDHTSRVEGIRSAGDRLARARRAARGAADAAGLWVAAARTWHTARLRRHRDA